MTTMINEVNTMTLRQNDLVVKNWNSGSLIIYKLLLDIRCTNVFSEDFFKVPIHFRREAVSVAWSTQVGTRPTTTIGTQVPSKKH